MKRYLTAALLAATLQPYAAAQDEAAAQADSTASTPYRHELKMLARAKGDSVMLRWAPDDYVAWRMLCRHGFSLVRFEYDGKGSFQLDTLLQAYRPLSSDGMKERFSPNDMMAGAANTLLHGTGHNAATELSSDDAMADLLRTYDEQQTRFSLTMLVAELRYDLAQAMALGFTDQRVRHGASYEYILHADVPDAVLPIRSCAVQVLNVPEPAVPYSTQVTDSISSPHTITLRWPHDTFTAYDVELRRPGGEWRRHNSEPYMMLTHYHDGASAQHVSYDVDSLEAGTYEFRLSAYDSFGDRTPASAPFTVVLPDLEAPSAPLLRRFELDRSQQGRVYADIYWSKPLHEPDFAGYNIYYYHETLGNEWRKLNDSLIAPSDTTCRCEVSGLASGFVLVQAVDTLGNYSPSTPYELHIADMEPPSAPQGLTYTQSPDGVITLSWQPNPENDVRGYLLYVANDTTHHFIPLPGDLITSCTRNDTISVVGVNQRFRYYQLRAYDYSGNRSEPSATLQVERMNLTVPDVCRFDSTWQHDEVICLRWHTPLNADIREFHLYRRLDYVEQWELVQSLPIDSVSHDYLLTTCDTVPYLQDHQYVYAIEAVNFSGISSGLSLPLGLNHWGPAIRDLAVTLRGKYNTEQKCVELTWSVPADCPPDYYFVVSSDKGRSAADDECFTRIESLRADQTGYVCYWLKPQQSACFYVEIYWRDRTRGIPSNIITLTNPYAPRHEENQQ